MDYKNYKAEDFALDPNFRKWVLEEDKNLNEFWSNWIQKYPEELEEMKKARKLLLHLPNINYSIPENKINSLWNKIDKATSLEKEVIKIPKKTISLNSQSILFSSHKKINRFFNYGYWGSIAALFIIALCFIKFNYRSSPIENNIKETYNEMIVKSNPWGQKSTIILPDGSEVILNSGSKISYVPDFNGKTREVILKGEAYFKISKDVNKPFVVQTGNLATTALGTEFNVKAYEDGPQTVVLHEGKVQVNKNNTLFPDQIILVPGEGIIYDYLDDHFEKFHFDEKEYLSWKEGVLYFQNSKEIDVIKNLEKWYGVKIKVENKSPRKWGYSGEFRRKSLHNVLLSIGFAMKFTHEFKKDTVIIKYNER